MPIKRVLVVDDSPTERHHLNEILTKAGFKVAFAFNGEEGVAKAKSEKPELIVMDVVMPGRNGFQACRDLKGDDRFKGIPIVLCTSKGNESDKFWGQQQGANGHVVKPFKSEELLQAVNRVLG